MSICVYGITALEILRSSGRLLPDLLECPRTSSLEGCRSASKAELDDLLPRLGAKTRPYQLMVPEGISTYDRSGVCRHRVRGKLPRASLIKAGRHVLVPTPELVFCQMATVGEHDEMDLALLGMELCGTYVLDVSPDSWKGFTNLSEQIASRERIAKCLDSYAGMTGAPKARRALSLVLDGSNSPMETVLAVLITFPTKLGGCGLKGAALNYRVVLDDQTRMIDIAFPDKKVGLEYKGRAYHTIEQSGRDDRRQNGLVGSGWTIINVWYEDLADPVLFENLISAICRSLGVRLRISVAGYANKRQILRSKTIPGLNFGADRR